MADEPQINASMSIDVRKFYRVISAISNASQIQIGSDGSGLTMNGERGWTLRYQITQLQEDPYSLPELSPIHYEGSAEMSSEEFCELTEAAAAVSNELTYRVSKGSLWIEARSGDYQLSAKPSRTAVVSNPAKGEIESHLIANYVRSLEPLIKRCDRVKLKLGNEKPITLDLYYSEKGKFSFAFSPKKATPTHRVRESISLPRITISKFPEFLAYLANSPSGEEARLLKLGHLETTGGDYGRLGKILGLVGGTRGKVKLTKTGIFFANVLKSDTSQAAVFLNKLLLKKVRQYKAMIKLLEKRPMDPDELYVALNSKGNRMTVDRQDLSTLLGLAMWCNVIDRRMSLYYFGRKEREIDGKRDV